MSVKVSQTAFVTGGAQTFALSAMFTTAASATNPAYLVLTALDRNEYAAGATGATGSFGGNGQTAKFAPIGDDGRGAGIVFTYQAATGRYYSSVYGYFDQLKYTASASLGDVTDISVFTTSDQAIATALAANPYALMQTDPGGYAGSVTLVTQPGFTAAIPAQATPQSIAAVAMSFVGAAWNRDGCWTLASTIAAEAGAALPVQTTEAGLPGQASGEWIVAFDGPVGQSGDWRSMVTAGEMIVFGTSDGGGHVTTCVSGSGASAMLVDNIAYLNAAGQITNAANDGSARDVTLGAAHAASLEWSGVQASSVVIYQLDVPLLTTKSPTLRLAAKTIQSLSGLFAASDPANRAIAAYQIYDTAAAGGFLVNGVNQSVHSAATALTTASLGTAAYVAASAAGTDTIEIRAFNGSYWNDWTALSVTVAATPVASAPVVTAQTSAQSWSQGQRVSFTLAANTFTDPQGQALTYSATLANGQALPSWLSFNAATRGFSGTVPAGVQSLTIAVTAKDSSGLSASEQFAVSVPALPPVVAMATPAQQFATGQKITLALPAATFSDPQGQTLTYTATQANGQALPGWLSFNAATDSFSGTAPITPQTLGLKVTATDSSGLSVTEGFLVSIAPAGPVLANQTADLNAADGRTFSFALPANTFSDTAGQHMSYLAYQVGGPAVTSWLHFNAATATLSGTAPASGAGTARIQIVATDGNHQTASETFNLSYAPAH